MELVWDDVLYAVYFTGRLFHEVNLPTSPYRPTPPHAPPVSTQLRHLNERSGKNHDKRQDLLQREGINKPKKSALLGIGRADLASVGAEDMFSKATYDPAKACAVEGLVETSVPGRYTPRKLAASLLTLPSADPATTIHTVSPPRQKNDTRGLLATTAPATVFRVIPTGLGYSSSHRAGRGEGNVPGIAPTKRFCAPTKRFCGSRSAPALGLEPQARTPRVLLPSAGKPTSQPLPLRSPRARDGSSERRFDSEGNRKPHTAAAAALESHMTRASPSETGSGRSYAGEESEGRSSALSQSLSRSHSDDSRGRSRAGTAGEHAVSGTGAWKKPSSRDRVSSSLVDSLKGSGCSRSGQSMGASPAQQRNIDQLKFDSDAVRSLEPLVQRFNNKG